MLRTPNHHLLISEMLTDEIGWKVSMDPKTNIVSTLIAQIHSLFIFFRVLSPSIPPYIPFHSLFEPHSEYLISGYHYDYIISNPLLFILLIACCHADIVRKSNVTHVCTRFWIGYN